MKRLQILRLPMAVFVLALLVRILYNISVARDYTPVFDAALYNTLARNLVDHGCYCLYNFHQSVSRPPLWPFVMALIYSLAGKEPFYARLFYCLLGSGTCVIVFLFARDLFGRKVALFSGILAAFYPCLFIYDGWLYSESLYTFLLTACVYMLYRLQSMGSFMPLSIKQHWFSHAWLVLLRGRWAWAIMCGVVVGLAALTRPNGLFLTGVVAVWGVVVTRAKIPGWKIVLQNVLVIICVAALIVLPWTYRNYQVTRTFVFVSLGAGEVLKGAYNDVAFSRNGQWSPLDHSSSHDSPGYTPGSDAKDTSLALTWIRTHLSALPYLLGVHFLDMWIPYTYSHGLAFEERSVSEQISIMMIVLIYATNIFVMAAATLGLICTWKRHRQRLLVVYLLLAFIIAQNVVFYGDMRFRAPIEPMLVLLAGGVIRNLPPF
jgi:4-amino-4-deoxy-L-arabinose transferase-like glycosyltransferase